MSGTVTGPPGAPRSVGGRGVATSHRTRPTRHGLSALPALRAMLERFLVGETGLVEFAKESHDFACCAATLGVQKLRSDAAQPVCEGGARGRISSTRPSAC